VLRFEGFRLCCLGVDVDVGDGLDRDEEGA